jgi:hypothetical protein
MARFRVFSSEPFPPLALPRIAKREAAPPSPHHLRHPTTFPHHPRPPVHMAQPKSSPRARLRVFFPSSPSSRLELANTQPHHHHQLIRTTPLPPHIVLHSHFVRRTRNRAIVLGFVVFCPPAHLPASHLRTHHPTTTTSLSAPHHHLLPLSCTPVSHGVPENELPRSFSWFSTLVPHQPSVCKTKAPPTTPPHLHHHTTTLRCHFRWRTQN